VPHPNCRSDQPPIESGPYATRFGGLVVYMICPECEAVVGFLPATNNQSEAA
jgi:hypothetical protein